MRSHLQGHTHIYSSVLQFALEYRLCHRCRGHFIIRDGCIVFRQEQPHAHPRASRSWWERVCPSCKVN